MDAQTWTMLGIILLGWGVLLLVFLWLGHCSYKIKHYQKCSTIEPDEVPRWCEDNGIWKVTIKEPVAGAGDVVDGDRGQSVTTSATGTKTEGGDVA